MMSLLCRIQNKTNEQAQQNRNGLIDPKNMLVVARGEGGGGMSAVCEKD